MNFLKGLAGAILGAAAAGALWAGLTFATGAELGFLAIAVGAAVGIGVSIASQGRGSSPAAFLAAIVAVPCILAANLGVAHIVTEHQIRSDAFAVTEDDARNTLVETVYTAFVRDHVRMSTPADEDSYPAEVWVEADRRWYAMTPSERTSYLRGVEQEKRLALQDANGVLSARSFFLSLGLFGIVYTLAGVTIAFGLAAATYVKEKEEEIVLDDDTQAPAILRAATAASQSHDAAPPSASPQAPRVEPAAHSRALSTSSQDVSAAGPTPSPTNPSAGPALGIFAHLGNSPVPPARSMLDPDPPAAIPSRPAPRPALAEDVGLINLDLDEDKQAA